MNTKHGRLCLVEDDPIMGESLSQRFALEGVECDWFQNGKSALNALIKRKYAALLSDIRLPDISGEELFASLLEGDAPPPATIFITGFGSIDQAVNLLKLGARDYITKPFDLDELLDKLHDLSPSLFSSSEKDGLEPVLGISPVMRSIQEMLARLSDHKTSTLITGESGVGKEYAAYYMHCKGNPERPEDSKDMKPFVAINCAALSESLLEAELFGHEKGAFTGATRTHHGVFEQANGGTLFLDEIGEMSPVMQAKLLRVIQDQKVQRVGGEKPIQVGVRLVCATNRDLKAMVTRDEFREDLFYRINVIHVHMPPLRERKEDIIWFAHKFLQEFYEQHKKQHFLLPNCEKYLVRQNWPGNIRELRHAIERACVLNYNEMLGPAELGSTNSKSADIKDEPDLKAFLSLCEREHLLSHLLENGWQVTKTASILGISRKNLWEKMRKYGLHENGEVSTF